MSDSEKAAAETKGEHAFQLNLAKFNRQERNVSHKPNSPTYAPTEFAKNQEAIAAGLTKTELEKAMRRLLDSGRIRIESYGAPSRGWTRLVINDDHLH